MKAKFQFRNLLTRSALVLAVAGLAWLPAIGSAQEKGATKLMFKSNVSTKAVTASEHKNMSCPMCKDSKSTVVEKTGKAVQPEIRHQMTRHECPGCTTTIVTQGHGKMKTDKAIHTCTQGGGQDAMCCATQNGGTTMPAEGKNQNHHH